MDSRSLFKSNEIFWSVKPEEAASSSNVAIQAMHKNNWRIKSQESEQKQWQESEQKQQQKLKQKQWQESKDQQSLRKDLFRKLLSINDKIRPDLSGKLNSYNIYEALNSLLNNQEIKQLDDCYDQSFLELLNKSILKAFRPAGAYEPTAKTVDMGNIWRDGTHIYLEAKINDITLFPCHDNGEAWTILKIQNRRSRHRVEVAVKKELPGSLGIKYVLNKEKPCLDVVEILTSNAYLRYLLFTKNMPLPTAGQIAFAKAQEELQETICRPSTFAHTKDKAITLLETIMQNFHPHKELLLFTEVLKQTNDLIKPHPDDQHQSIVQRYGNLIIQVREKLSSGKIIAAAMLILLASALTTLAFMIALSTMPSLFDNMFIKWSSVTISSLLAVTLFGKSSHLLYTTCKRNRLLNKLSHDMEMIRKEIIPPNEDKTVDEMTRTSRSISSVPSVNTSLGELFTSIDMELGRELSNDMEDEDHFQKESQVKIENEQDNHHSSAAWAAARNFK